MSIPVFVLDSSAKDPETLCSSRCTTSHLVKVRTSSCSVFLALLPPSELTIHYPEPGFSRYASHINGVSERPKFIEQMHR